MKVGFVKYTIAKRRAKAGGKKGSVILNDRRYSVRVGAFLK